MQTLNGRVTSMIQIQVTVREDWKKNVVWIYGVQHSFRSLLTNLLQDSIFKYLHGK